MSSKCPWGNFRLQFMGPSFAWENISWPLLWLLVPFWGNHRVSLMWLQGSLEVTSGYPWPWVASGVISDYPRHHQRLKFQRITTHQAQVDLRLAWPELFSLFLLRVWCISSVVMANEWGEAFFCPIAFSHLCCDEQTSMSLYREVRPKVSLRWQDFRFNTRTV